MKLTTVLTLFLATSALSAHAQALDRAQSHDVPMITTQAAEFAAPDWTPSALGVHAQSTTAANPYDVPMFAGHVENSQCDACDSIVVGSETGFASPNWTPSASDEGNQASAEESGKLITPVTTPSLAFSDRQHAVQITGVVTNDGEPVPGATVNVEVELDGGFVNAKTIVADKRGFYTIRVPAPAKITAVRVEADGFCSVKNGCMGYLYGSGAGAIAQ